MKYFMSENTTRKVDALGRVSIPKSLRDRLDIAAEDEMEFFMMEYQGRRYVALANTKEDNN
jgi:AbrB family looped-hinge helix DNA binding protein